MLSSNITQSLHVLCSNHIMVEEYIELDKENPVYSFFFLFFKTILLLLFLGQLHPL